MSPSYYRYQSDMTLLCKVVSQKIRNLKLIEPVDARGAYKLEETRNEAYRVTLYRGKGGTRNLGYIDIELEPEGMDFTIMMGYKHTTKKSIKEMLEWIEETHPRLFET